MTEFVIIEVGISGNVDTVTYLPGVCNEVTKLEGSFELIILYMC
jgi:hypothetical protein